MSRLERRLQILLSKHHYELLEELSKKEHCSLAELTRRALEQNYLPSSSYRALASLHRLEKTSFLNETQWKEICANRQAKN